MFDGLKLVKLASARSTPLLSLNTVETKLKEALVAFNYPHRQTRFAYMRTTSSQRSVDQGDPSLGPRSVHTKSVWQRVASYHLAEN